LTEHRLRRPTFRAPRLAVDLREALGLTGTLVKYLSLSALVPAIVALLYSEPPWPFLAAGAIAFAAGFGLERLGSRTRGIGFREGYLVVALTWLIAAIFGAIPYLLSGEAQLDGPVDAFFESMSGFSTTGATVLTNVENVDHSLLLWRQFTQWLGGMGIIVLALAVLPRLRVGGRQLLESELAGPETEALTDRIRTTARRLWLLYIALTGVLATVLVLFGIVGVDHEMGLFEAVSVALATMPTGGFTPMNESLTETAAATQWVVILFMVVAGINFALVYRALVRRRWRRATRDQELRLYLGILVFASIALAAELWADGVAKGEAAVRHGVFQVVSITTTTGFASTNFATWATFGLMLLLALMFVGGSAGSTGSSVKVVRHLLVARSLRRELRQTLHPEEVLPVRLNGQVVQEKMLRGVVAFVLLYVGLFVIGAAVVAIDTAIEGPSISAIDAIAAAATTLGNVGPGLGIAGPLGSFASYPDVSKLTLSGLMWLGRLEIIPVVVVLTRHYWRVR
jgi:trk system potassium uptake protein TrkH